MSDKGFDPGEILRARGGAAARNGQLSGDGDDGDGVGLVEKGQTLMLRLVTSTQGSQWLTYGSMVGGRQADDGTWFELLYKGILLIGGKHLFGDWSIMVKGEGLEPICHHVAKGVRSLLKTGKAMNSHQPVNVASIVVNPIQVEMMESEG